MRLLLLNGNTDSVMTERLRHHAAGWLARQERRDVELVPCTARFGARYIATRAAVAVAGHAVLEAIAEQDRAVDRIAIACFGEPGFLAAREIARVPVRGMAEASIAAALALAPAARIALLTGGEAWLPMLREHAFALGHGPDRILVRAVPPAGDALARDPDGAARLLARAAEAVIAEGAGVVVLGGAGLAGLAPAVSAHLPVPVLDSLDCLLEASRGEPLPPLPAPPSAPSSGLSTALSERLGG